MSRICPRCGKEYFTHPALSRVDNKTEICPECGLMEALGAISTSANPEPDEDRMYHRLSDELDKNTAYYISLTRGLTGYYIKVLAYSEDIAREYAASYYGNVWCSVYVKKDIDRFIDMGYKTIIINENDPIVLGDSPEFE